MLVHIQEIQEPPNSSYTHFCHTPGSTMAPSSSTSSPVVLDVFDTRTQIVDNCEFIIGKDDETVQVITSKNHSDKLFRAYAIQGNGATRTTLLRSEPCENAQKAVESLLAKSSEAIDSHLTTGGVPTVRTGPRFPVRVPNKAQSEPRMDDDDAASIISGRSDSSTAAFSEWGTSGDEAMAPKLTPETSTSSNDKKRPGGRDTRHGGRVPTGPSTHEPARRSRAGPVPGSRDFSDYTNWMAQRSRPSRPDRFRSPSSPYAAGLPPPPPGHLGPSVYPAPWFNGVPVDGSAPMPSMMPAPSHPQHASSNFGGTPYRLTEVMNQTMIPTPVQFPSVRLPGPHSEGPPIPLIDGAIPPPRYSGRPGGNDGNTSNKNGNGIGGNNNGYNPPRFPYPTTNSHMRSYTVLITVKWQRHGQHRIITQCQPTRESLQNAAMTDVRMNPDAFTGDKKGAQGSNHSADRYGNRPLLRAQVHQAVFAGEPYDLRTFHAHDLTRLFQAMAAEDNIPSFEIVVDEIPTGREHIEQLRNNYMQHRDDSDDNSDDDDASTTRSTHITKTETWTSHM
ncbi:hypothetical protein F4777DRAFT_531235 [Nemania sp. FL0916]|nr:hypothetical protein F4777DRAFT_531235 [Nemania sp. FL0916]